MSSTLLEQARAELEDLDALELAIVDALDNQSKKHKDRVLAEHRVAAYLNESSKVAKDCLTAFADEDGSRRQEIASMVGDEMFGSFYSRLRNLTEYHQKYSKTQQQAQMNVVERVEPTVDFSGEECFGKYLDLTVFHDRFINFPSVRRIDYLTYLSNFDNLKAFPKKHKGAEYRAYITELCEYLIDLFQRTQPLVDASTILKDFWDEYMSICAKDGPAVDAAAATQADGSLVLQTEIEAANSAADLESVDLETLKLALQARGLKCGGTAKMRAARLFAIKGLTPEQYPKKHLDRTAKQQRVAHELDTAPTSATTGSAGADAAGNTGTICGLGVGDMSERWIEHLITRFKDVLTAQVSATKTWIEKKQTRIFEEREAEMRDEEEEEVRAEGGDDDSSDSSDDEEAPIYNPLNLPLGWDGKPIPYWLYKLHGLGQEFKCEICGNRSYWGPRAYNKHFQEYQHAYGMRCLGIPNTKHFHGITNMADAQALYAKLKDTMQASAWDPETQEEFEDSEGNVMTKKTYEDLARQGLL